MISKIISRAACLRELASNPKSFSNCPDLHGGVPELARDRIRLKPAVRKKRSARRQLHQRIASNTSNKSISNSLTKMTMTIQKWLKEEKMRLGRFGICCVNAQKKEAKSFPLKMSRSCWRGQYRTWDDSLDALAVR
jgi:hypothetical protein